MKSIDVKSLLIGVLSTCLVFACVGLQRQAEPAAGGSPRYQVTTIGDSLFVLDHQTNHVSLIYRRRVNGKNAPDWPWVCESKFSLAEALAEPNGAPITPGPGR